MRGSMTAPSLTSPQDLRPKESQVKAAGQSGPWFGAKLEGHHALSSRICGCMAGKEEDTWDRLCAL
jgi:hypothetical protein